MSFEEEFPNLKDRVGLQERQVYDESDSSLNQASSDYSQVFEIVDVEDVEQYCLSKERVREKINRACRVMHFQGCVVIPIGSKRTRAHDILEELYRELNL